MKYRHNLDAYYTASQLTHKLFELVITKFKNYNNFTYLEPCCGKKAISNIVEKYTDNKVCLWDIDPTLEGDIYTCDASKLESWDGVNVDWIVSNPPYTQPQCQEIIEHSFNHVRCGIAMLLRLSYDEPCAGRAEFLRNTMMSHQIIFNPRPQFRHDTKGTDNVTSCWFVWLTKEFSQKQGIYATRKIYVNNWKEDIFNG